MSAPFFGNCLTGLPKLTGWVFSVDGGTGICSDIANAITWLNLQTPAAWNTEYTGTFNTPASTVPDSEGSDSTSAEGSVDYSSSWNANYPTLIKSAVLCADPTLYVVGFWAVDGSYKPQATCILSGIPSVCGVSGPAYAYNLPVPSLDGCNSSSNPAIEYQLYDEAGWEGFQGELDAEGGEDLDDPGPCNPLPGDPFDDDDP